MPSVSVCVQMMTESQVNKAQMEKDIEYKTDKVTATHNTRSTQHSPLTVCLPPVCVSRLQKNTLTGDKTEKMQDREGAQKELDASLQYYEKLKPACVDTRSRRHTDRGWSRWPAENLCVPSLCQCEL